MEHQSHMVRTNTMEHYFVGWLFCFLWFMSIFSGFLLLYCPLLPLMILHPPSFRYITDRIFSAWELFPVALVKLLLRTRIVVTGDAISPHEGALLVMNHRTRLDWNFLWAAMFQACPPLQHRLKFVLKAPIRLLPGPGWVMQMCCFLYVHRLWERDKPLLKRTMDYLADIDYNYQVLLFPEGTDLTARSQRRSHEFAELHHLQRYERVLHPKTTGFVFLAQRMRRNGNLDAIYDLSIGYPKKLPQGEVDLLTGHFPEEVHFHITRYPASGVPSGDSELKEWLAALWRKKEAALNDFYETGSFRQGGSPLIDFAPRHTDSIPSPDYSDLSTPITPHQLPHSWSSVPTESTEPASTLLLGALVFWTMLSTITVTCVTLSTVFCVYACANCMLFFVVSYTTEGMQEIEISVHDFLKRWLPVYRNRCRGKKD